MLTTSIYSFQVEDRKRGFPALQGPLSRAQCTSPTVDKNNPTVGMVGYSNGQFPGGSKRMKPGWSSDPNHKGGCAASSANPDFGNGSWASNNQSLIRPNNGSMKPLEPRFNGNPMKKLKIDIPKWKYLNEHRKMCGPYSLRQLMDGLKDGFLKGSLPIYGVEDGKLGKAVALKDLVEGVGGCSDVSSLKSCSLSPHISQEKMRISVQRATSSVKVKETCITASSGSQSQQISFSTPSSSSVTAQHYPPSSVQVRFSIYHHEIAVVNFY